MPNEIEELLLLPPEQLSREQNQRLLAQFVQVAPELAAEREAIKKLRDSLPAYPTALVMQQRPAGHTRATFVHHRGEFLQPKDEVTPGILQILSPLAEAGTAKPAGVCPLARQHREPARRSRDGEPPLGGVSSAPASSARPRTSATRASRRPIRSCSIGSPSNCRDRGWSIKSLHRLMVTSATYRQSSQVSAEQSANDPQNRLLLALPAHAAGSGTGPRLGAANQRAACREKIGGPSVFPASRRRVTTEGAYGGLGWNVSPGEDRYRRGLYTFSKRTAPFAMFATFDGPSGEACVARREISNTPLQALTMLNDPPSSKPPRPSAPQAATSGRGPAETARPTSSAAASPARRRNKNCRLIVAFYEVQKQRLAARELDAEKIAGPGEGDAIDRAAWTLTARAILNLDEAITKE